MRRMALDCFVMRPSSLFYSRRRFRRSILVIFICTCLYLLALHLVDSVSVLINSFSNTYRRRAGCACYRRPLPRVDFKTMKNLTESQNLLCSEYATRRGPNQRIISISLFGPKENKMFQYNISFVMLKELIHDVNTIYPDNFTLRVHHDHTLNVSEMICPIECEYPNVDFCDMSSKLFIPPKIWRFIPAGDPLVDVMISRDLDSALTRRERAAVDEWLASNKPFHVMRDHPNHVVPMLGGMWGFRPALDPPMSLKILEKIHEVEYIKRHHGFGDQIFLGSEIWPHIMSKTILHDSFLCNSTDAAIPIPFPTQRPSANETNCFVGCSRSCCGDGKMPFGECPKQCRPKDHPEWIYC